MLIQRQDRSSKKSISPPPPPKEEHFPSSTTIPPLNYKQANHPPHHFIIVHVLYCIYTCVLIVVSQFVCSVYQFLTTQRNHRNYMTSHHTHGIGGEGGMRVEVGLYISSIIVYDHIMCCICGSFKAFRMRFTHEFFGEDLLIQ